MSKKLYRKVGKKGETMAHLLFIIKKKNCKELFFIVFERSLSLRLIEFFRMILLFLSRSVLDMCANFFFLRRLLHKKNLLFLTDVIVMVMEDIPISVLRNINYVLVVFLLFQQALKMNCLPLIRFLEMMNYIFFVKNPMNK